MIQAGSYRARASGCDFTVTKTGKEQVVVPFRLVETGELITWFGFLTDATQDDTLEGLAACGWDAQTMSIETAASAVQTHEVEIVVQHEEYEGTTRAKVRWVRVPGRVRVEALPPAKLQSLGDRLRARALVKGGGKAPARSDAAPPTATSDDDMPF